MLLQNQKQREEEWGKELSNCEIDEKIIAFRSLKNRSEVYLSEIKSDFSNSIMQILQKNPNLLKDVSFKKAEKILALLCHN